MKNLTQVTEAAYKWLNDGQEFFPIAEKSEFIKYMEAFEKFTESLLRFSMEDFRKYLVKNTFLESNYGTVIFSLMAGYGVIEKQKNGYYQRV